MRELKFRLWDENLGMCYEPIIGPSNSGMNLNNELNKPRGLLMQYTGQHDKDGKEIYEGDIVSFEIENADVSRFPAGGIGEIRYKQNLLSFGIYAKDNIGVFRFVTINRGYDAYGGTLEVKGNIYENPEIILKD